MLATVKGIDHDDWTDSIPFLQTNVESSRVRSLEKRKNSSRSSRESPTFSDSNNFERGDRVEAKVRGWTKYYPGKVDKVNRDGTLDLKFDDGDFKGNVPPSQVRSLESRRQKSGRASSDVDDTADEDELEEGDKIEAK